MYKKNFFIISFIFCTALAFGASKNSLSLISFAPKTLNLKFKNKPNYSLEYVKAKKMIYLDIKNCKTKLKNLLNNGEYIKSINIVKNLGSSLYVFINLKNNIKYTHHWDNKNKILVFKLLKIKKEIIKKITKTKKSNKKKITKTTLKTIVIDPGHGGKDPGAIGCNGIHEKNIVFAVAKKLKTLLEKEKFRVVLTRRFNQFSPLYLRPRITRKYKAALFISLHANSSKNRSAFGLETFFYSKRASAYAKSIAKYENNVDIKFGIKEKYNKMIVESIFYRLNQEKSIFLAETVNNNIVKIANCNDRGIYGANFSVLRNCDIPAVLVEVGFITNRKEAKLLNSSSYQKKIAKGITIGINKYFADLKVV